jgi:EAL and modified HD-GYP domain-containing signal transduction protein
MGLLSLIDTLLGRPLPELLGSLPITEDVRHALLGDDNPLGNVHHLAVAYEWGDWAEVSRLSAALDVSEAAIPEIYLKAIEWGNSTVVLDGAG